MKVGHVGAFRRAGVVIRRLAAVVPLTMIFVTLVPTPALAAPSANLDQCANGAAPSPNTDGCDPIEWVNGNVNQSKAVYFEGDSIPYRMRFGDLTLASHTVTIEWDTTKSGKHAIDYLTTWNRTVTTADPCVGVTGCGAFTTFPIPLDPQVAGAGVTQVAGNFTLFGGTITGVSAYTYPDGAGFTGDKSASITITFTADVANPVLAWGGHIASRADWGIGNSAVNISGSPYHMGLVDLDGKGGNQDRSLSASAVVFPATINIVKDANGAATQFNYTASPAPLTNFSLTDGSGTPNPTQSFTLDAPSEFTTYTVTEADPSPGYALTGLTCVEDQTQNTSTALATRTATIVVEEGEIITCTFTNTAQNAVLTIDKVVTEDGFSAPGEVLHYTITATNEGNVTLTGVTVSDPLLGTLSCTPIQPATLAPGESIVCTGTYTTTQGDVDFGRVDNTSTADSNQTEPVTDDATVPATQNPNLTILKTADVSTYDSVGDVITYTVTVTNTGNVTLHNVTVVDPGLDNFDCTPDVPTSLAPNGQIVCTGTHTITQADLDAGSFLNTSCADSNETTEACDDETVTADDNPALTIDKEGTLDLGSDGSSSPGDVISYTYVVTNTGNVTLHNVVVTDSKGIAVTCPKTTLVPGESMTCTATYPITAADITAGKVDNTGTADSDESEPDSDDETVPIPKPVESQIAPTATTCAQFRDGTAATLSELLYMTKSGTINSVAPGVFFYWIKVDAVAGSNTFVIHQNITTNNFASGDPHFFSMASGSAVFTSSCVKLTGTNSTITQSGADTTVTFNASSAGTYIIGIKYDSGSVKGFAPPTGNNGIAHYEFSTGGTGIEGIDLKPKQP